MTGAPPAGTTGATGNPAHRLEALDALRGVAALAVTWFHIYKTNPDLVEHDGVTAVLDATHAYGWLGVPVFFVITGFIIPYATFRYPFTSGNTGVFLAKRFVRLYPPFAASVALSLGIAFLAPLVPGFAGAPPVFDPANTIANLLLLAPVLGEDWIVPVYWTLLVEAQYYLVIAAIMLAGRRWRGPDLTVPLLLGALALPAVVPYELHALTSWTPLFVVGYAVYLYRIAPARWLTPLLVGLLAVAVLLWTRGMIYAAPVGIALVVMALGVTGGRVLLFLGTISYSLYLVHYDVGTRALRLVDRFVDGDVGQTLAYLAAVGVSIAAAAVFYYAVERPSLVLSGRIRYARQPARTPAPDMQPAADPRS